MSAKAHGVRSPLFATPERACASSPESRVAQLEPRRGAVPALEAGVRRAGAQTTLADVEAAEDAVREILRVRPEENMRACAC